MTAVLSNWHFGMSLTGFTNLRPVVAERYWGVKAPQPSVRPFAGGFHSGATGLVQLIIVVVDGCVQGIYM